MKSFGIKRDANDPRWAKFEDFIRKKGGITYMFNLGYYGLSENGIAMGSENPSKFDRIITLDEWEAEFVQPNLAGREYDEGLLGEFRSWYGDRPIMNEQTLSAFLYQRYAKQDRISEIKAEIEKLSIELKELEG